MIPIVFAFDNNLSLPAAVCIYSLFANAHSETQYQVYILHRNGEEFNTQYIDKVFAAFPQHSLSQIGVDGTFDSGFEIRGITTPAYYRLLIPTLIPEHDKVIYSDVDVIFRNDLTEVYNESLGQYIVAGVNNLAHLDADLFRHYKETLKLDPKQVICSGLLIMDTAAMRKENLQERFVELANNRYKFQDQDVINISCAGRIKMLDPKYSLLTYIAINAMTDNNQFLPLWTAEQIDEALNHGNIHYNGRKPWQGYCLDFDIWWEYYRKSPIFEPEYYFKFFYNRLEEPDTFPLMKRVKNLVRYFVYGRKKLI